MFNSVRMKGKIESVISYYERIEGLHVMQLQFHYAKPPKPCRPYQVFTFKFTNSAELQRCIFDFKSAVGVKEFNELRNKVADVSIYVGQDENYISGAEINEISLVENGKRWFPMAIGVSEELEVSPSIFS